MPPIDKRFQKDVTGEEELKKHDGLRGLYGEIFRKTQVVREKVLNEQYKNQIKLLKEELYESKISINETSKKLNLNLN